MNELFVDSDDDPVVATANSHHSQSANLFGADDRDDDDTVGGNGVDPFYYDDELPEQGSEGSHEDPETAEHESHTRETSSAGKNKQKRGPRLINATDLYRGETGGRKKGAKVSKKKGGKGGKGISGDGADGTADNTPAQPLTAFDEVLERMKAQRRRKKRAVVSEDEASARVNNFINLMSEAADNDDDALSRGEPATHKLGLLSRVTEEELGKLKWASLYLVNGVCKVLERWIQPLPSGGLPNLMLRTEILKMLRHTPVRPEHLSGSNLGHNLVALWHHPEETDENRQIIREVVQNLVRPILSQGVSHGSKHLNVAAAAVMSSAAQVPGARRLGTTGSSSSSTAGGGGGAGTFRGIRSSIGPLSPPAVRAPSGRLEVVLKS